MCDEWEPPDENSLNCDEWLSGKVEYYKQSDLVYELLFKAFDKVNYFFRELDPYLL